MSTPGQVYLLECSSCGAKITTSGQTVGGNASCNPHKYGPVGASISPRAGIVYPSDKERNWLRLLDDNKQENEKHTAKFVQDIDVLSKNKTIAMTQISSIIKRLRIKLDERRDVLEQELTLAFQERHKQIEESIKQLKEHKLKNTETKENAEDLLVGNKRVEDREEKIVSECESILDITPNLKYIETELRYTFDELESIDRRLSMFGTLHIKSLDAGLKCIFHSLLDAKNTTVPTKPKTIIVPTIKLNSTTFDYNKQRVKLVFKVKDADKNEDLDINMMDYINVHILCTQELDDDEKKNEALKPHEETVAFKDCKMVKNRYELYVSHKFMPGITVELKMRARFQSPDDVKYESGDGAWSRSQLVAIPEEDNHAIFNIELHGKSKRLSLDDDDVALTNFDRFERKFMRKFNVELQHNEKLVLRTKNGTLNEKSRLATLASDSVVIYGDIVKEEPAPVAYSQPPQDAEMNNMISPRNQRYNKPAQSASPRGYNKASPGGSAAKAASPGDTGIPAAAAISAKLPKQSASKQPRPPKQNGAKHGNAPKQISSIVVYGDTKKRVVLKNNPKKDVYEYTMDTLRQKLLKKFGGKGLKGHFDLRTDTGKVISIDEHIVDLVNYKGEIKIVNQ